ncbi:hypothetical protein TRVL_04736 [Trypanosoma vivax]|nr:hypothetical protein TRVL_04736 [Trypanosoma vivax]
MLFTLIRFHLALFICLLPLLFSSSRCGRVLQPRARHWQATGRGFRTVVTAACEQLGMGIATRWELYTCVPTRRREGMTGTQRVTHRAAHLFSESCEVCRGLLFTPVFHRRGCAR